jgi:N utilization substance protein B
VADRSRRPDGGRDRYEDDPRSEARERAMALRYEAEAKGCSGRAVLDALPVRPDDLAVELVEAVDAHLERIDELIVRFARGWSIARMPAVDRAVLRIAIAELLVRTEVPIAVVLDEAVELAKRFGGTDESGRFVNGVLASVARELRAPA